MKFRILQLLSSLFILLCVNCFADFCADEKFISCPKTYVAPDQIVFHENAIFVQVNNIIMETQSINADEKGLFFANAKKGDCGPMQWKCTKELSRGVSCNTCNWNWNIWCNFCEKARGND